MCRVNWQRSSAASTRGESGAATPKLPPSDSSDFTLPSNRPASTPAASRPLSRHTRSPGKAVSRLSSHARSEEHTSELQSLMRISYAVFCLKKKKSTNKIKYKKKQTKHNQQPSHTIIHKSKQHKAKHKYRGTH